MTVFSVSLLVFLFAIKKIPSLSNSTTHMNNILKETYMRKTEKENPRD
jgi:hypothetical protein